MESDEELLSRWVAAFWAMSRPAKEDMTAVIEGVAEELPAKRVRQALLLVDNDPRRSQLLDAPSGGYDHLSPNFVCTPVLVKKI